MSCAQAASEFLIGDVLLACAMLTYCGAMPHDSRLKLLQTWQQECQSRDIVTSEAFSIAKVLSKPTEVCTKADVHQPLTGFLSACQYAYLQPHYQPDTLGFCIRQHTSTVSSCC